MNEDEVAALVKALKWEELVAAGPAAVNGLLRLVDGDRFDDVYKIEIIRILARIGDPKALPSLLRIQKTVEDYGKKYGSTGVVGDRYRRWQYAVLGAIARIVGDAEGLKSIERANQALLPVPAADRERLLRAADEFKAGSHHRQQTPLTSGGASPVQRPIQPSQVSNAASICSHCKAPMADGSLVCRNCGKSRPLSFLIVTVAVCVGVAVWSPWRILSWPAGLLGAFLIIRFFPEVVVAIRMRLAGKGLRGGTK